MTDDPLDLPPTVILRADDPDLAAFLAAARQWAGLPLAERAGGETAFFELWRAHRMSLTRPGPKGGRPPGHYPRGDKP